MKTRKLALPTLLGTLFLIPFLVVHFSSVRFAQEVRYVLNLVFYANEQLEPQPVDVDIKIWKISERTAPAWKEEDQKKKVQELARLTPEELNQKYTPFLLNGEALLKSDDKGRFVLNDLTDGYYYVRELSKQPDGYRAIPFIFEYPNVYDVIFVKKEKLKPEPPPLEVGRQRFQKIASDTQKPLAGASFKVMQKTKEGVVNYLQNGQVIYHTSQENGVFEVTGLPKGEYLLWEVSAPKGYRALHQSIAFTINGADENNSIILIENKPDVPQTELPDTGDMLFYLILAGGFLLFLIGWRLTKEKKYSS